MTITVNGQEYSSEADAKRAISRAKREESKREAAENALYVEAEKDAALSLASLLRTIDRFHTHATVADALSTYSVQEGRNICMLPPGVLKTWRETVPVQYIEDIAGNVLAIVLQQENVASWYSVGFAEGIARFVVQIPGFLQERVTGLAEYLRMQSRT